mmetsp:Transcript_17278/g.40911  ORF Transcript_17278/g.40911 Transcript_17278/m.40911 type:complete len:249 (-) Transcript_17278:1127-1873(-)
MATIPGFQSGTKLVELLLEDVDEGSSKQLPPSPWRFHVLVLRIPIAGHLANEAAAVLPEESANVWAMCTGVLPNKVSGLIEDLPCKVLDAEKATGISTACSTKRHMTATGGSKGLCQCRGRAIQSILEVALGSVIDHTKDAHATMALKQSKSWQLAGTSEQAPLPIKVQALRSILLCLPGKHLAIEELLQTLVAVVDQELLKAVGRKDLEAIQIKQSQHTSLRLRRSYSLSNKTSQPHEEHGVQLLGE